MDAGSIPVRRSFLCLFIVFDRSSLQLTNLGARQSHHGRTLETKIDLEVLSDCTHQAPEWKFSDEKLAGFVDNVWSHGEPQQRDCSDWVSTLA